jgi:hypothetical protein
VIDEVPINIIVKPVEQEPEDDEEENGLPFLGLPSLLFALFLGGALRRKRDL